jgi:RNA polymerase sigma-70 factor (ECF subfamily)
MSEEPVVQDRESPLSDADLLRLIAQRDESAMAELVRRFQGRVLNLAYRFLGNRDDAEIVVQDAFIKVWNHAGTFKGTSQVWTWLYRISVNICLTHRSRRRMKTEEIDESIAASPSEQPRNVFERKELQEIVQRALDALPADQRMAIILSRYEGMSYEEIGATLNRSVPAVATLIFRAKDRLRAKLTPYLKRGKISP